MKDENGIEVKCKNCAFYDGRFCDIRETFPECHKKDYFLPAEEAYIARIAELQKELNVIQESERAEAQEADRLRGEVKELGTKLTETVKLLSEQSRECGKLEALLEVKNRSDMSTQSTDTEDVVEVKK